MASSVDKSSVPPDNSSQAVGGGQRGWSTGWSMRVIRAVRLVEYVGMARQGGQLDINDGATKELIVEIFK